MSRNLLDTVVAECAEALAHLGTVCASDAGFLILLRRLGWPLESLPAPMQALATHLREAGPVLRAVQADNEDPAAIIDATSLVAELARDIDGLASASFGGGLDAAGFGREIGIALLHWIAIEQLDRRHPALLAVLRSLGIVVRTAHEASDSRPAYVEERLVLPDIGKTFTSPSTVLRAAWAWGDPAFDGTGFLDEVVAAFRGIGVSAGFMAVPPSERDVEEFGVGAVQWHAVARLLAGTHEGASYEAGLRILPFRDGADPGLAVLPYVTGSLAESIQIGDELEVTIAGSGGVDDGRALVVSPTRVHLVDNLLGSNTPDVAGEISATLRRLAPNGQSTSVGPIGVQSKGWSIRAVARGEGTDGEVFIEAAFSDAHIGLPAGDDGFLAALFDGDRATVPAPLVVGVSSRRGVYIGPSGLAHELALSLRLGPIDVQRVTLALDGAPAGVRGTVGTTLAARMGPVTFGIEGLGLALDLQFPGSGGNLGPIAVDASLRPPTRIGLAIDAGVVHGGGFLEIQTASSQYAGAVFLELGAGIGVKALGLLTTRMPDGSKGFSLLVIITAEGFRPIPLGFGFMLAGIGGLLGIHRTASTEALQASIRDGSIDAVLAPVDPVGNATQYLAALRRMFPPAADHHLVGPVVEITWGAPTLVTINLALVFEFGVRTRFFVLGSLSAILPRPETDLVRLRMNVAGGIDFDQQRAFLDAVLVDSRLVNRFVLTGEMRMRMSWGDQPFFALAVGGLHPAFTPPPGLEAMKRIAIVFADSDDLRIRCDAYFALTSNTVQFGARVELFAKASKFSVSGQAGFDVLIHFDPFHFVAAVHASLQLKAGSRSLFKVKFQGELSGPRPLHAKGKATFEIFWCDFSVSFNRTLISGDRPPLPAATDVAALLRSALEDRSNWRATLPGDGRVLVALQPTPSAGSLQAHPIGVLGVTQKVVPLGVRIERFGNTPIAGGPQEFHVTQVTVGTRTAPHATLRAHFAPAQFREMDDAEKLSSPPFESLPAGVEAGGDAPAFGPACSADIEYEEILVPPLPEPPVLPNIYVMQAAIALRLAQWSAVGLGGVTRPAAPRYAARAIAFEPPARTFSVVSTDDLAPAAGAADHYATRAEALDAWRSLGRERRGQLQIISAPGRGGAAHG